jgi:hypothetical protein
LNLGDLASSTLLASNDLGTSEDLGIRVEAVHDTLVLERVLLLGVRTLLNLVTGRADNRLDFVRVDETVDIGVGHDVGGENIVLLQRSRGLVGTVELVQKGDGALGPDDETTQVATRCKL